MFFLLIYLLLYWGLFLIDKYLFLFVLMCDLVLLSSFLFLAFILLLNFVL